MLQCTCVDPHKLYKTYIKYVSYIVICELVNFISIYGDVKSYKYIEYLICIYF